LEEKLICVSMASRGAYSKSVNFGRGNACCREECVMVLYGGSFSVQLKSPVRMIGLLSASPSIFLSRSSAALFQAILPTWSRWVLKKKKAVFVNVSSIFPQVAILGQAASQPFPGLSGFSDNQKVD